MQPNNTPKLTISGAQRRNLRVAQGLPKYTPKELADRKASAIARRNAKQTLHAQRLNEWKMQRGCTDCGLRPDDPAQLHFDHLPGYKKLYTIGNAKGRSWQTLLTEISKCEVVCIGCHNTRTATRARQIARRKRKRGLIALIHLG